MFVNTPRYLGPVPHPAVGVRIPDIFLRGILSAYDIRRTAGGLMLSCTREAAPQYVIDSPSEKYPITLGHTGMSVKEYMTKSAEAARKAHVLVEIEADHLIVGSYPHIVQRMLGSNQITMTEEEVKYSLSFVMDAVDEAVNTGFVSTFTVDTTSLVDLDVERYPKEELVAKFNSEVSGATTLLEEYSREFRFSWINGSLYIVKLSEEDIMRSALQFNRSLEYCFRIYRHIGKRMGDKPFGFELTLDELPRLTGKELVYYLREWKRLGGHADFIAPNIGFRKRADFDRDLENLKQQISFMAAVAHGFGALLSIHSGSGENAYCGKGKGVYQTIVEATAGQVKYKISGIYFELLMDILAKSKTLKHRKLFARIVEDVSNFWQDEIIRNSSAADGTLENMFHSYARKRKEHVGWADSRSDFFRHYSFVALNLRDDAGNRYLKDELLNRYEADSRLRRLVDKEVEALTLRLIDGVSFANNLSKVAVR